MLAAAGFLSLSVGLLPGLPIVGSAWAQGGPPDHSNAGGNSGNAGNSGNNGNSGNGGNGGNSGNNGNNGNPGNSGNPGNAFGGGPPSWAGGGGPNADGGGPGNSAFGQDIRDSYNASQGNAGQGNGFGPGGVGNEVLVLSDEQTQQLIANGWGANVASDGVFANHGQRVRTMVEIAQALGYPAHVGALQANFGTSQETGIAGYVDAIGMLSGSPALTSDDEAFPDTVEEALAAAADLLNGDPDLNDPESVLAAFDEALAAVEPGSDLEQQLLDARDDYETALTQARTERQEEIGDLEQELRELAESVKPGDGPNDGWELVDLDVNGDGVVDAQDLIALDNQ